MKKLVLVAIFLTFSYKSLQAQTPTLIKEINPNSNSAIAGYYFVDNLFFFEANDGQNGTRIWRTDGTEKGTFWIGKTIVVPSTFPTVRKVFNNKLYFTNGHAIFRSDGTENGTYSIGTFDTIGGNSVPIFGFLESNGQLRFFNNDDNNAIYKIGDTANETSIIRKLSSAPLYGTDIFYAYGIFYTFNPGLIYGYSTYNENLKEFANIPDLKGSLYTPFNGQVYYVSYIDSNRGNLWQTDGTLMGTKQNQTFTDAFISTIDVFNNKLLIGAQIKTAQYPDFKIWVSDGTLASTKLLFTHTGARFSGFGGSKGNVITGKTRSYFVNNGFVDNYEGARNIIQTDGTAAGTKLIDFPFSGKAQQFYLLDDELHILISEYNNTGVQHIYALKPDGTLVERYTHKEKEAGYAIGEIYPYKNGKIYFKSTATLTSESQALKVGELWQVSFCSFSAKINTPNGTSVCINNGSVNISAEALGGTGNYSYTWKQGNSVVGNSATLTAKTVGTYTVEVSDNKGCSINSSVQINLISPNTSISTNRSTNLSPGQSVVLSVPSATGQTYQWLKDDVVIPLATNNTYTATQAGQYKVMVTINGCTVTSSFVTVTLIVVANEPLSERIGLQITPNPVSDQVKILLRLEKPSALQLLIIDMSGKAIRKWELKEASSFHELIADLQELTAGNYIVRVEAMGKVFTQKLIKN